MNTDKSFAITENSKLSDLDLVYIHICVCRHECICIYKMYYIQQKGSYMSIFCYELQTMIVYLFLNIYISLKSIF